jgi:hypothetical protein
MATRVIEAEARIKGTDLTGPAFKSVEAKIASLNKSQTAFAKVNNASMQGQVEALSRFTSAMRQAEMTAGRIAGFRQLHGDMINARQAFRQAEISVRSAAQAIQDSGAKTGAAAAQYRQAQRAVAAAADSYRDKATAVKAAKAELASYGVTLQNMNRQDATARALSRPQSAPTETRPSSASPPLQSPPQKASGSHAPISGGGLLYTLPLVGGLIKAGVDGVTAGARVDSERARMRSAGWNEKDIETAEHRGNRFAAQYGISPSSAMMTIREARQVFGGDLQETLRNVPDFLALRTAMKQGNPTASDDELDTGVGQVIKSAEIRGDSKDPVKLNRYADFMTRMFQVHGSGLKPEQILNLAKRGKTAFSEADFDFLASILPTLLPEQGGDPLGTALMTSRQALVGGKMKHLAARNLAELGLIKDSHIERDDVGDIKGVKRGGLIGADVAEKNLAKWVYDHLLPAMDKKGIAPEDRGATISSIFSDRNAEYVVSQIANNRERMQKDKEAVDNAKGLKGAEETLKDDPRVAAGRLKAALETVGASLTDLPVQIGKVAMDVTSQMLTFAAARNRGDGIEMNGGYTATDPLGFTDLQGRLKVVASEIERITAALHPSRRDAPHVELDRLRGEQQDLRNRLSLSRRSMPFADAEGALGERGRGVHQPTSPIAAEVKQPIPVDVTGKVQIDPASKVAVNIRVQVDGPGRVTGMTAASSGNAAGNVGTSTAE